MFQKITKIMILKTKNDKKFLEWPSSIDILSFGTYIAFGIVRAEA